MYKFIIGCIIINLNGNYISEHLYRFLIDICLIHHWTATEQLMDEVHLMLYTHTHTHTHTHARTHARTRTRARVCVCVSNICVIITARRGATKYISIIAPHLLHLLTLRERSLMIRLLQIINKVKNHITIQSYSLLNTRC